MSEQDTHAVPSAPDKRQQAGGGMGMSEQKTAQSSLSQVSAPGDDLLYAADLKMAELLEKDRLESEQIAEEASKEAEQAAADAAAKLDLFKSNDLATSKLSADQAKEKASEDARNAAIAQEEMMERSQVALRFEEQALGDLYRSQQPEVTVAKPGAYETKQ